MYLNLKDISLRFQLKTYIAISYFHDISSISTSIFLRWLRRQQVEDLETWLILSLDIDPAGQTHRPRNCFEKIFLTTYRGDEWPIPLSWQEKLGLRKLSSSTCCKLNEIVQVCWAMGGFVWQSRIFSSELRLGLHVASDSQLGILGGLGATFS